MPESQTGVCEGDSRRASDLHDAMKLLARLREWLDFTMWFITEHPHDQPVRYDWFVVEYPEGSPERARRLLASATGRVLDFTARYRPSTLPTPTRRAAQVLEDEKEQGVPIGQFAAWLRGELGDLVRAISSKTGDLPPWFPRDDIFPTGKTVADAHADYLALRKQVIDTYARLAAKSAGPPPFYAFPEAVPLRGCADTDTDGPGSVAAMRESVSLPPESARPAVSDPPARKQKMPVLTPRGKDILRKLFKEGTTLTQEQICYGKSGKEHFCDPKTLKKELPQLRAAKLTKRTRTGESITELGVTTIEKLDRRANA